MAPLSKKTGVVRLEVTRYSSGFNSFAPKYILSLISKDLQGSEVRQELMVAKKKLVNRTSNYVISLDIKNPRSKGPAYLGKLRATSSKKDEYFLFGPGENPKRVKSGQKVRKTFFLAKFHDEIIEGLGRVKRTKVFIPFFNETLDDPFTYNGVDDPHELGISQKVHSLKNKRPKWSKSKQKYVFKFDSHIKEPSNLNTQLTLTTPSTLPPPQPSTIFQFGKSSKSTYSLSLQSPLSLFQAFSLCLSIYDTN